MADSIPGSIGSPPGPLFPQLGYGRAGLRCARIERALMNDAKIAHNQAEPRPPIGSAMLTVAERSRPRRSAERSSVVIRAKELLARRWLLKARAGSEARSPADRAWQ